MIILSLSNHGESSASICDTKKKIVFAVSEERFTRIKNSSGIPKYSINFLLKKLSIKIGDVDKLIYCSTDSIYPVNKIKKLIFDEYKNLSKYEKKVFMHRYLTEVKFNKKYITQFNKWVAKNRINKNKVFFLDHHEAHARSAIFCQKKKNSFILTCDGKGGFTSSAIWQFKKEKLKCLVRNSTFNSLGYLYGNVTIGLGFKAERHEGKITGLSAFGKPNLNLGFANVLKIKNKRITARNIKGNFIPFFLRGKNKWDMGNFFKEIKNSSPKIISATVQKVLEDILIKYIKKMIPKKSNLLLSGGIFANVKLNQKIKNISKNRYLFVAPPMSDFGLCLGGLQKYTNNKINLSNMFLGPNYTNSEIIKLIKKNKKINYKVEINEKKVSSFLAKVFKKQMLIGIFNGNMEFGPRALCNRSIIFPATKKKINQIVNSRLNRTEFMPFAPVILDKFAKQSFINYQTFDELSEYMTVTYKCKKKFVDNYPAACHIDHTARPQVLKKKHNRWFYKILENYYKITKHKCLMNTSFNNHEEPIVCSPRDAIQSLFKNNVDYIIFNKSIIVRKR